LKLYRHEASRGLFATTELLVDWVIPKVKRVTFLGHSVELPVIRR